MRRSSVGSSNSAPAPVGGAEPVTADPREPAAGRDAPRPASRGDALPSPAMNGLADSEMPDDVGGAGDAGDVEEPAEGARRARWTAAGTGVLLALAGLAASVLRASGTAPAFVPAAYAFGAAVCAVAAGLGSRGRTRRALWLLILGVLVMAVGDQFD